MSWKIYKNGGYIMAMTKIEIEPKLFKIITEISRTEGTTEKETINNLIKKGIKATKKPTAEDIVNNNPKLNFMKKTKFKKSKDFEDMIGIVKAPEGFDPVEAVKEVRRGDL